MSFLKPDLKIKLSEDLKSYTLEATVVVPNGCYISNGTEAGLPSDMSNIPEAESIKLLVSKRRGMCTMNIGILRFIRKGIPLSAGKNRLTAYVVLDDETDDKPDLTVTGIATITIPQAQDMTLLSAGAAMTSGPPKSGAWISTGEVSGWINRMPVGNRSTIHLRVGMWAPTSGYAFEIDPVGPWGFTGLTLLCDVKAVKPTGLVLQVLTHTIIKYDADLAPNENYTSLLVRFEGGAQMGSIDTVS